MIPISKWMISNVITITDDKSVREACCLMSDTNVGSLVVIDSSNRPIGVFTERNVLREVNAREKDVNSTKVSEVMNRDIRTATADRDYLEVYTMMFTENIRHLPIVDKEGVLSGIVSIKDFMHSSMRTMENSIFDLERETELLRKLFYNTADNRSKKLYEQNRKLLESITLDGLTGLFNYEHFRVILAREVLKAKRHFRPLVLLFIDIDHFKHYNDINGHERGNTALKQISEILENSSRRIYVGSKVCPVDIVVRYGGEEFVILMPETKWTGGMARAKRLLNDVRNYNFHNKQAQPSGNLTVSVGIAEFPKQARTDIELIEKADSALYRAKRSGRDRIC